MEDELLLNLSIFVLSLILSDDRDHGIFGPSPLLGSIESICAIVIILTVAPLL